ncbi:MAG: patatin-like phospholipase RssA [Chromatiales bacterium]|nr:patatin-like phospholipase RssA [Chromatiales bacterium]
MANSKIGLVLGSGSARGWAHIGVIRALEEHGIRPDIVTGCSIGSLVGAAYVGGHLDILESWVRKLNFIDVVRLLDVRMSGGLIEGDNLMSSFRDKIAQLNIEQLPIPYAAVATDLNNGREVWLQQGSLPDAVRASIALPGLFSPVANDGRWLVDGGLTNPVPVSLCRAMGADIIIAVNLNSDIVGKHLRERKEQAIHEERDLFARMMEKVSDNIKESRLSQWFGTSKEPAESPGLFEVMASAINIMQDRITKSRMAGDPPDVLLSPRLGQLGLLEFDRAEEAIAEGYDSVRRMLPAIQHALPEQ